MTVIWKSTKYTISLAFLSLILNGCNQSDYTKAVKLVLAKGIRQDSILFGIKFGDTQNEFFGTCFDLNKKHLVTQGPTNSSVQYLFTDALVHENPSEIRMLFYPSFDQKKMISEMNLELSYTSWAPWNRKFQPDSLKVKAMELLMTWYKGNKFVTANINNVRIPVKLDGNRRILIFDNDAQSIVIKIQDILHPKFQHSINRGEVKEDLEN